MMSANLESYGKSDPNCIFAHNRGELSPGGAYLNPPRISQAARLHCPGLEANRIDGGMGSADSAVSQTNTDANHLRDRHGICG